MKQTLEEFRGKLGLAITWIGILGLPLGVGVVLGYYAGDRGVLWLPTMLHILLVITIGSVLAIIGGRAVLRGASHDVVALHAPTMRSARPSPFTSPAPDTLQPEKSRDASPLIANPPVPAAIAESSTVVPEALPKTT